MVWNLVDLIYDEYEWVSSARFEKYGNGHESAHPDTQCELRRGREKTASIHLPYYIISYLNSLTQRFNTFMALICIKNILQIKNGNIIDVQIWKVRPTQKFGAVDFDTLLIGFEDDFSLFVDAKVLIGDFIELMKKERVVLWVALRDPAFGIQNPIADRLRATLVAVVLFHWNWFVSNCGLKLVGGLNLYEIDAYDSQTWALGWVSEWASKGMSAAERASEASSAEQANKWAVRVNERTEEWMVPYSTHRFHGHSGLDSVSNV